MLLRAGLLVRYQNETSYLAAANPLTQSPTACPGLVESVMFMLAAPEFEVVVSRVTTESPLAVQLQGTPPQLLSKPGLAMMFAAADSEQGGVVEPIGGSQGLPPPVPTGQLLFGVVSRVQLAGHPLVGTIVE